MDISTSINHIVAWINKNIIWIVIAIVIIFIVYKFILSKKIKDELDKGMSDLKKDWDIAIKDTQKSVKDATKGLNTNI
jgi:ABC-type bacteriocin/lantibiotic exporter with double-glycine peptidase domain